ncbi:MAG: 5'-nucleotidase C-terminal domain-containing protein [Spirochaetales bacterium]|nr:5'-nucleotidase C-terminal domain-containing protein [Spirochaetales bacterium]
MKKRILLLLVAALFLAAGCQTAYTPSSVEHTLVVLHTNDHHGHPLAFFDYPAPHQGGLPARATLVQQIRGRHPYVMVLDAGDFNTGRPESNFFKAEPDIIGYNYIGYDAVAVGNHEFDPAPAVMQQQIALSDFPWLCANVKTADGKPLPGVSSYVIKDYGDFRVAVFGLLLKETEQSGNPAHIKGYTFLDEVETARTLVPELEKKADIVIALVHLGLYDGEMRGSRRLAAEVPGIDLIIDGHTHTRVDTPVKAANKETGYEVPIVQAKHWGLYVGKAALRFKDGEVLSMDYELLPVNVRTRKKLDDGSSVYPTVGPELEEDRKLAASLKIYADNVQAVLGQVIGRAEGPFMNDETRVRETAVGDAVADSMLWYARHMGQDADFAFQNGGGVRTTLPEGDIQKGTVYEVLPFDNSVAIVSLKGTDVAALFERTPETVGHGAMPQVSDGVSFTIDTASGTISGLTIGGEPVDPDRIYRIATNSYLAAGGDGYTVFNRALDVYDMAMMQRDVFIEWVINEKNGVLIPVTFGRITVK